jgi:hypothetical protein
VKLFTKNENGFVSNKFSVSKLSGGFVSTSILILIPGFNGSLI